jgi:cell division protein FtsQ
MTIEVDERQSEAEARIHPRIWSRRVEVTRELGKKRLRIALIMVSVVALCALGYGSLHSPLFSARDLKVTGAVHTPAAQVLGVSGLVKHPPLVDIDAQKMQRLIESLPWIESAAVRVHWPDSVTVEVKERKAVGAVERVSPNGAHGWTLVDGSDRVLAVSGSAPAGLVRLTVPATPGAPGSYLAWADRAAVVVAATLPRSISSRTVSVDQPASGSVSLQLTGGLTAVLGAPVDLSDKYQALASVLSGAALASGDFINVTVPQTPTVAAS